MSGGEEKGQWYSNKELFEKIEAVAGTMGDLQTSLIVTQRDLQSTRDDMRKYNDLRGQIAVCQQQILSLQTAQSRANGRSDVGRGIREWLPTILVAAAILAPWLRDLLSQ
jgi:hypothetical protein